jgi:hypothetical protein
MFERCGAHGRAYSEHSHLRGRSIPTLELDSGRRLVDHLPLRTGGVGQANERPLARKDRATLDPADIALVDAGLLGEIDLGEAEELPSLSAAMGRRARRFAEASA